MRKQATFALLLFGLISVAQTECTGGMAGGFPCNDYDLMSQLDLTALSAGEGNDSWGWTDPLDNNEYAIVGLNNGTAFINITDPVNPTYLGKLPTATSNSSWRDIKVYANHAYIVSEAGGHGMQVFDLTRLRGITSAQTWTSDFLYSDFGACHNIAINEDTGFAYAIGNSTFSGGPHFIDLSTPDAPVAAGGYATDGYTHDAQIVTYNGPDTDHTGKEIFFGCNENEIVIVDVSNKTNPIRLSTVSYSQFGYVHQGWLTEDHTYFILGDETDELGSGFNTRTILFDFTDLDNPAFIDDYEGPTAAIDHNGYTKGNLFFQANYSRGLTILDTSDVSNGNLTEVGFFDTYPPNNNTNFRGVWSVYPYFASGNIVLSDINGGFFLVRQSGTLNRPEFESNNFSLYPNPTSDSSIIQMRNGVRLESLVIYNILGQNIFEKQFSTPQENYHLNTSNWSSGTYIVKINNGASAKLIKQ